MDRENWFKMHSFNHAPAAMRIFRFAVDTVPRTLEIAHVSKFFRECAIDFDGIGAVLPIALRNDYATGRYFELRDVVERNRVQCPWLMEKILTRRDVVPIPSQALEPDVTRHDVNWGAEGTFRYEHLQLTHNGFGLKFQTTFESDTNYCWAQGPVGVTSGKHWFSITIVEINTTMGPNYVEVGWISRPQRFDTRFARGDRFKVRGSSSVDCIRRTGLRYYLPARSSCTIACLLDLNAGIMTVFIDGEIMETESNYRYHADCEWFPTVGTGIGYIELYSNSI
jgi:hypothetical protein